MKRTKCFNINNAIAASIYYAKLRFYLKI